MKTNKKINQLGVTIIEIAVVLAIGGTGYHFFLKNKNKNKAESTVWKEALGKEVSKSYCPQLIKYRPGCKEQINKECALIIQEATVVCIDKNKVKRPKLALIGAYDRFLVKIKSCTEKTSEKTLSAAGAACKKPKPPKTKITKSNPKKKSTGRRYKSISEVDLGSMGFSVSSDGGVVNGNRPWCLVERYDNKDCSYATEKICERVNSLRNSTKPCVKSPNFD